jgi:class 3 adenylate cyclase
VSSPAAARSLRRHAAGYAGRLAGAHLLAIGAAIAIVIPLGLRPIPGLLAANLVTAGLVVLAQTVAVAIGGYTIITPALRWYAVGAQPDSRQRRAARRLVRRQSMILAAAWSIGAAAVVMLNLNSWTVVGLPTAVGALLGAMAAISTAALITQRYLRPLVLAAITGQDGAISAPDVMTRLMVTWLLCGTVPCLVIAGLIVVRSDGWIIAAGSAEIPVLVVAVAAVLVGLPAMFLISRSISDPLQEVIDAMSAVEHGHIGTELSVYERSQIGRLQRGFNNMISGLAERDMLRDLFGRHVGPDVARRAIEEGATLSGDVREAAVLFIDLAGSTQFAASHPPQQVAEVLNEFFGIVVREVDYGHGLINKFQGDAALAIFGVPLPSEHAESEALATARAIGVKMLRLPMIDFGIGVSAGSVFAGNIGAQNRYEFTVIGDAVNEAARLAELAKSTAQRIVCSGAALDRAATDERDKWVSHGHTVLRGRSEGTALFVPANVPRMAPLRPAE